MAYMALKTKNFIEFIVSNSDKNNFELFRKRLCRLVYNFRMPGSRVTRERRSQRAETRNKGGRQNNKSRDEQSNNQQNQVQSQQNALAELTQAFLAFQKTVSEKLNITDGVVATTALETVPIYTAPANATMTTTTNALPWTFQNNRLNPIARSSIGNIHAAETPITSYRSSTSVQCTASTDFSGQTNSLGCVPLNATTCVSTPSDILIGEVNNPTVAPVVLNRPQTIELNDTKIEGKLSNNYIHLNLPLSAQVPEDIKLEIWAGGYVDLKSLLFEDSDFSCLVLTGVGKGKRKLGFKSDQSKQLTISQWITVFNVYSSVYLQKHPKDLEGIFTYIETVRGLEKKGGNWRFYDEQFRKMKKSIGLSWGDNHQALWLDARLDQSAAPKESSGDKIYVPIGFCQKFHQGQFCKLPCKFNHRCFKCGITHPAIAGCQWQNPSFPNATANQRPQYPRPVVVTSAQSYQSMANQQVNNFGFNSSFRPNYRNKRN